MGLALMVRGPKRLVELTPAGERLLAFARATLASYETLERELAALKSAERGRLSLAASTIPGDASGVVVQAGLRTSEALSESVTGEHVLWSIIMFGLIYILLFSLWLYVLNNKIQQLWLSQGGQ